MSIKSVDLKKDILKARPNLKPRSIEQYVSQLHRLQNMFDAEVYSADFNFLGDFDKVKNGLSEYYYLSQRNYINAIIVLLMALNIDDTLIDKYVKLRDKFNAEYNENNLTGVISDKQEPNFTTTDEIFRMLDMMKDDLKDADKTNLTKKEKQLLQAFVLFSVYARMPLRNDTAGMRSITGGKFNKLSQKEKTENNFLIVGRDRMYFLLNDYKTSKNYGALDLEIKDKELKIILKNWIKVQGYGSLFRTSTEKPITRIELSKIFLKYSEKYLDKKISTNLLRKIYLSSKYAVEDGLQDQLKNLEADNAVMGHSKGVALNDYIKKPKK
tara:strand:- start:765 stop:1742 length:978 start_codon:yes stop_codon:yes gene_type:complete